MQGKWYLTVDAYYITRDLLHNKIQAHNITDLPDRSQFKLANTISLNFIVKRAPIEQWTNLCSVSQIISNRGSLRCYRDLFRTTNMIEIDRGRFFTHSLGEYGSGGWITGPVKNVRCTEPSMTIFTKMHASESNWSFVCTDLCVSQWYVGCPEILSSFIYPRQLTVIRATFERDRPCQSHDSESYTRTCLLGKRFEVSGMERRL